MKRHRQTHSDWKPGKTAALSLAKLGIPVIPLCPHDHTGVSDQHKQMCTRYGKTPLLLNWRTRASTDPDQIATWFDKLSFANIGMVLGKRSGIIAIDVDGEYGQAKLEKLSSGQLPQTWEFETPGGGYRYLYAAPVGYTFKKFTLASPDGGHEEIALLGDGQQTVMPGSIHANSRPYTWAEGRSPDDIPLAQAPEWMLKLMSDQFSADRIFDDEVSSTAVSSDHAGMQADSSLSTFTSTYTSTSTSKRTDTSVEMLASIKDMPVMSKLTKRCAVIDEIATAQLDGGCDEESWFKIISLLSRLGAASEADAFSRRSLKHNARSQDRLEKIKADAAAKHFGPPRCTRFGCGEDQIRRCFGNVQTNKNNEIANSPAWFLTRDFESLRRVETLLKRTKYRISAGKLGAPTFDKNGEENGFSPIANFVAIPVREVSVDNGLEAKKFFEIEGVMLSDGMSLPPLRIEHSDFTDLKWISEWGLLPNLEPFPGSKDRLRHSIQQLAGSTEKLHVYAHLGFRKLSGSWRYLHAGGCLGDASVEVGVDKRLEKYKLPASSPDIKAAVEQSLSLLDIADARVTTLLLATVYLAPLCEALRQAGIEPAFVVWIHGQTGTRKSSLAALYMCHYGSFSSRGAPASFKDTANSLERRAFDTKDSILWIDDFHPNSNVVEARKMEQIVQAVARAYGDRVGRGRLTSTALLRPDYPPRGLAIGTGEQFPDGHSSNARLQAAELLPESVDLAKLTAAQAREPLLAEAMAGYVQWVGERMNDSAYANRLKQAFHERREMALAVPGQAHGRLAEAASWLYLGLDSLLEFALEVGAVTEDERRDKLTQGWESLLAVSETQSEQVADAQPAKQFLSVVSGMLQNGSLTVLPADRNEREKYEGLSPAETHVGWRDDDHFYFLPDILYNKVNSFLSRQDERVPLKQDALWKQLEAEGCLVPEVSRENGKEKLRRKRKKGIDGKRPLTVWLRRECLEEHDEETSENRRQARRAAAASGDGTPREDVFGEG
ncbi:bifunctional DNA primase/polymerase [uncultured Paenibacillus sp.]|uniref:bifunctional DNA primase/polymerase n=1 Tax=uncultured Paenibacillus sp. TaxID=227322 RepID=UPI0028D35B10|nr:bifunctional DNA primase/polymerase [uncultured Paenibacillus sp.]